MEDTKELFTALAKAQGEMGKASRDASNPYFGSTYADLESCTDAIRPVIAKFGLAYIQICHESEKAACIETVIVHQSGQQISCGKCSVPVSKLDAQGFGSAMTYARRNSLSAAFGLAAEDDDGNAAVRKQPEPAEKKQPSKYDHAAAMRAMGAATDGTKIARIIDAAQQRGATADEMQSLTDASEIRKTELKATK